MAPNFNFLKVLTADSVTQSPSKEKTVGEITANMTQAQQDAWLHQQISHTVHDMRAKGIKVDESRIGPSYVTQSDSGNPNVDPKTNGIVFEKDANIDAMTPTEIRPLLAHEIDHTQRDMKWMLSHQTEAETLGDHAAVKTYGAKAYNDSLEKQGRSPFVVVVSPEEYEKIKKSNADRRTLDPSDPRYDGHAPEGTRQQENIDYENSLHHKKGNHSETSPTKPSNFVSLPSM